MGSLCCVAARPHGTSSTNREWPLTPTDPFDPFWRTNTTFSLTPNDQFYRRFHSYRSHGSQSSNGMGVNYSSLDSQSDESDSSRSWERFGNENNSVIEGAVSDFSNLEGGLDNWQDGTGRNHFEDFVTGSASRPPIFSSFLEETSFLENSYDSSSSLSDSSSDSESITKPPQFAPRSLPTNLQSFPKSNSSQTLTLDSPPKCSICNKLLTKRSPWCPRRIIRNSDMPVIGILSCSHAYHSECLDRTTSKSRETDPACPVCDKRGTFSVNTEQWAICRMKNGSPRLRALSGEGSSRVWSCKKDANLVVFSNNCVEI